MTAREDAAARAREVLDRLAPPGSAEVRAMRWVARDTLRELRGDKVVARVRPR